MRASDADRDKVADVLRDAYADGRLTRDEVDERLSATYTAMTYGELVPVLHDLPVPDGTINVPALRRGADPIDLNARPVVHSTASDAQAAVAIFGAVERRGAWHVPASMTAVAIFGGGELDYTEATLEANEVVINVFCLFGGLTITVPEGLAVRNEMIGIFGGTEVGKGVMQYPSSTTPVLVIKGAAVFGGIEIQRPKRERRQ